MSVFRNKSEILLLEPCDGKLSRTVLRGGSARKGADLPAPAGLNTTLDPASVRRVEGLRFETADGRRIEPLYDIHHRRYVVYWNLNK